MRIAKGDLWSFPATIFGITTNGTIKHDGTLVMGRGVALAARERYPDLAVALGRHVRSAGNVPALLWPDGRPLRPLDSPTPHLPAILSFPTKHDWRGGASISLIVESARAARELVLQLPGTQTLVLPAPGCGLGRLPWPSVEKALERVLVEDSFVILLPGGGQENV